MNKGIKFLIMVFLLLFVLYSFFEVNKINYTKHKEIKNNIVNHPENIPKKETARLNSFWFNNLRADIYWLEAIQYIWGNVINAEYKKYLYTMLDFITELNPYFEHPYIIWELLLPSYNERYETLSKGEKDKHINQAIKIWVKWVKNFCDFEKVHAIENEYNLEKLWSEEKYKDPCKSYRIPYYLAYIYYYYKHDWITAAKYYKVASANKDSVEWAKVMSAIMQWKWWDREKSIYMFLNLAKNIEKTDNVCIQFSNELEKVYNLITSWSIELDENLIQNIELTRKEIFEEISEENEEDFLWDTKCKNYANKAIRELNLFYIEEANKEFEKDHKTPAINAKELFNKWYIKFLPTDFQQYEDYWIIYEYNKDLWVFDYEMWSYDE